MMLTGQSSLHCSGLHIADALYMSQTRWQDEGLDEHKAANFAYNKRIARHGVFSDGIRRF